MWRFAAAEPLTRCARFFLAGAFFRARTGVAGRRVARLTGFFFATRFLRVVLRPGFAALVKSDLVAMLCSANP